jgi:hypothetical protein
LGLETAERRARDLNVLKGSSGNQINAAMKEIDVGRLELISTRSDVHISKFEPKQGSGIELI